MSRLVRRYRHTPRHSRFVADPCPLPASDPWARPSWDVPTLYLPVRGGAF